MIVTDTFKLMQITATQMFARHSISFINPSKHEAFNNGVVWRKLQSHIFIGVAGRLV